MNVAQLKGQQLAEVYAAHLSRRMGSKCWGRYEGGGWIEVSGHIMKVHPDFKEEGKHRNGWSMLVRERSGKVRRTLAAEAIPEWAEYEAIDAQGQVLYFETPPTFRKESGEWVAAQGRSLVTPWDVAPPRHPEDAMTKMYRPEAG